MDSFDELSNNKKDGFFKYVFNFDNNNKGLLINLFQYAFIAVPLVILILKVMNYYTPEEDNSKGSLEILLEIIVSISILLLAVWFINKIIRYIPNISKLEYPEFNEVNFLLPFLIVLLTMQTKLGGKINILVERLTDLYDGKTNLKNSTKQTDYKTTQPISQIPGHQPSQADFVNNQQPQQPNFVPQTATPMPPPNMQQSMPQQQAEPSFNNSFQGPNNHLVNASEPIAANEMMGGSSFGTPF